MISSRTQYVYIYIYKYADVCKYIWLFYNRIIYVYVFIYNTYDTYIAKSRRICVAFA